MAPQVHNNVAVADDAVRIATEPLAQQALSIAQGHYLGMFMGGFENIMGRTRTKYRG